MAQIHNEHNGQPINEAERLVINALKDELPHDFWVIPCVEIDGMEIDAIVVAPFAVIAVEVKGYHGRVVFKEQEHLVDSERRDTPHTQIAGKARKLKSRLKKESGSFRNYWVDGQVVLAQEPQQLLIDDKIKNKVCLLDEALLRFTDPELIIRKNWDADPVEIERVVRALGVTVRQRQRPKFGSYETLELIDQTASGRTYRAKHEISGQIVLLQIHEIDRFATPEEQDRQRDSALKAYEVLARLSQGAPTPEISGPIDAFKTDYGDIVVVSREEVGPTLRDLSHQDITFSEDQLLAITRDVSRAIMRAHSSDPDPISHRKLSPSFVHTLPSNDIGDCVARVAGWDRAELTQSVMSTMHVTTQEEEHAFWAPEVHNSQVVSWQSVDLFALGTLVRWLWHQLGDQPVPEELDALCEQMCSSDPEQRLESSAAVQVNEIAKQLLKDMLDGSEDLNVERVASPTEVEDLVVGSVIADRYEVIERLGSGATSGVFAVYDQFSERDFALKVFRRGIGLETVRHEYSTLENLNHPSVVRALDIFPADVGLCLKMELVRGETLRQRLDTSGPLDAELCVPWFRGVLDALDTLHDPEGDAQVVHRDIKPENLIITEAPERLVLLDFGLAASQGDIPSGGTSRYRPATQLDPSDPRNDLFALAVVLHEALTGEHPFQGDGPCEGEPSLSDTLTPDIAQVIGDVLALHEPDWMPEGLTEAFQFETALAMALDLDAFAEEVGIDDFVDKSTVVQVPASYVTDLVANPEKTYDHISSRAFLNSMENLIVIESDKFPGPEAVKAMQQVTGRTWDGRVNLFPITSYQEIVDMAAGDAFAGGLSIDSYLEESMMPLSDAEWEEKVGPDLIYDIGPKLVLQVVQKHNGRHRIFEETPSGRTKVSGVVQKATFWAHPNVRVDVELCTTPWSTSPATQGVLEQWVQVVDAHNSPREFHRLIRLTSRAADPRNDERWNVLRSMDLRQAQIPAGTFWPKIKKASLEQLDLGLGANVTQTLLNHGAEEVGIREEVWGDTSNRRNELCVTYDGGEQIFIPRPPTMHSVVPLVAYGICRIAPLIDDSERTEVNKVWPTSDSTLLAETSANDMATELATLPPLSVPLRIEKGNGWTWAPDCGYWACHKQQPWRQVASPFATLNSAIFGPTGARALLHESDKLSGQIKKFGVASAAVIRVKEIAVMTDGSSIVAVPWNQVAGVDKSDRPAAIAEMIQNHPSPTPLNEYAEEDSPPHAHEENDSRVSRMLTLCGQAMPLWDAKRKGYPSGGESVATQLATELNELHNELAQDCLANLQRESELAKELRLPESPGAKQGQKRWRSSTWIDLMFTLDKSGDPIDYDKLGNSPHGANLFRIWFTAAGIGMGVRPGLNKNHTTGEQLCSALPDKYVDLQPKAQGPEEAHPNNLVGVRGRKNHYYATWSSDLQVSDEAFIGRLLSAWEEIGPTLSEYRN